MMLRPARTLVRCACGRVHEQNQSAFDLTTREAFGGPCLREQLERRCRESTGRKAAMSNGLVEYFVDGYRWTWQQEERGPYPPYRNEGGWLLVGAGEFR